MEMVLTIVSRKQQFKHESHQLNPHFEFIEALKVGMVVGLRALLLPAVGSTAK